MILFLYGQDSFRSHEKLMAIKARYIDASLGDTNLSVLDFSDREYNFNEVVRQVLAMPFLAKSRLVIIKNLLTSKKFKKLEEQIIKFLPQVPESTVLVFYEAGLPDKRSALFKKLTKEKSQQFQPLEPYQVREWIKKEIVKSNAQIDPEGVELLIKYCGNDLWKLKNEINKLISYGETEEQKNKKTITYQGIELLVRPKVDARIFDLADAFSEKNSRKAHEELSRLLEKGENELYIFTMIVGQFRNLLIIKELSDNCKLSASWRIGNWKFQIAQQSGLHPYVAQKTIIYARNFTLDELKKIYQTLLDFDLKIKTGELESRLALDLLIVSLCGSISFEN